MLGFRSGGWLAAGIAVAVGIPAAQADIYKWVGENGSVVLSNVAPKHSDRVVEVIPTPPPDNPSVEPPRPSREDELAALAAQVDALSRELAAERRARAAALPPPASWPGGCEVGDTDCAREALLGSSTGATGGSIFWPSTVIVTRQFIHPHHHHLHRPDHRHAHFGHKPGRQGKFSKFPPRHPNVHSAAPDLRSTAPHFQSTTPHFRSAAPDFRSRAPDFRSGARDFRPGGQHFRGGRFGRDMHGTQLKFGGRDFPQRSVPAGFGGRTRTR